MTRRRWYPSWWAEAHQHVFLLVLSAKTWMQISVGMMMRGIDHESELLAVGMTAGVP
jgi:hypothetical protein